LAASEVRESTPLRDPKQAAAFIGVHPQTLLRMALRGAIPSVRIGPRTVRFTDADLQAFIESKRVAR
jgi:excisionase family DNA binding protein